MDRLNGDFNRGYTKAIVDIDHTITECLEDIWGKEYFRSKKQYQTALHSLFHLLETDSEVRDHLRTYGSLDGAGVVLDPKNKIIKRKVGELCVEPNREHFR